MKTLVLLLSFGALTWTGLWRPEPSSSDPLHACVEYFADPSEQVFDARIFKEIDEAEPVVKIDTQVGDKILVIDGPFKDFAGEVIEVSTEQNKLKALLSIFGRDTPVELEFNQVEKQG